MKHYSDPNQEKLLVEFLSANGISLSENILEKLFAYVNLVIIGNEKVNLISKNDIPKFLTRHIADSLFPYIVLSKTNYLKPGITDQKLHSWIMGKQQKGVMSEPTLF